jgi:hypothetical protein
MFEKRVLKRIFGEEVPGTGENYIIKSFIIGTLQPFLVERLRQGIWEDWLM